MYEITVIADIFLTLDSIDHKKLQKLCFYANAYYLALNKQSLVNSDFQAWVHGPVSPVLYNRFKNCGWNKIPQKNIDMFNQNHKIYRYIKEIYKLFGEMSANELEKLSHNEQPWIKAREDLKPNQSSNRVISTNALYKYYSLKLNDSRFNTIQLLFNK